MTRLWWVRHGPTHQKAMTGWRDVPADLSDAARIARLDSYLPQGALLVSSDLIRAVATADVLAHGRERLAHDRSLREFDFGRWDGLRFDEIPPEEEPLSRAFWERPGDIAPPEGESWNAVSTRVHGAVEHLLARHQGRDIVIVAHIGVIVTHIARAGGLPPYTALGHHIDTLSVTSSSHDGSGWHLGKINHQP